MRNMWYKYCGQNQSSVDISPCSTQAKQLFDLSHGVAIRQAARPPLCATSSSALAPALVRVDPAFLQGNGDTQTNY